MKFLVFLSFVFLPILGFAGPNLNQALPSVNQEANKVIQSTKEFNPLSDCFTGSMFTSQSPTQSIKQINSCVTRKINNLPGVPPELKAKIKDIPSMGWQELLNLKNCFDNLEAMKKCSPTYQLLNHDE